MPSDTKACSTWLSIGSSMPAIRATSEELPAAASPSFRHSMKPLLVSTPFDLAVVDLDAVDLAILDNVDAAAVRAARIAPRDGIMTDGAAAPLQYGAADRKAALSKSRNGTIFRTSSRSSKFTIDAVNAHRIAAPRERIALRIGMEEIEHAALADHGIVIEILLEPLPEFHRPFVKRFIAGKHIVRADDGGVAADIARTEPALFQHGDIGDAVLLGEIIGRCIAVTRRRRRSPRRIPPWAPAHATPPAISVVEKALERSERRE